MLSQHAHALNEPQRVLPIVRVDDVRRHQRRRREYAHRRQDAIALSPTRCLPEVYRAHSEYHRWQQQRERAQIYRQAYDYAAQQERANSVLAKGAVGKI